MDCMGGEKAFGTCFGKKQMGIEALRGRRGIETGGDGFKSWVCHPLLLPLVSRHS